MSHNADKRTRCSGSGKVALRVEGPKACYPHCPDCLRDFGWAGRKGWSRNQQAWKAIPTHYQASPNGRSGAPDA